MKVICRILSLVFLAGGALATVGLLMSSASAAGAGSSVGAGVAVLISFGSAIASGLFGVLFSVLLWWMGNVHDYLRDLSG